MTTQTDARNAILQRMFEVIRSHPSKQQIPIAIDNQSFDSSSFDIWVELTIEHTSSVQQTLGRPGNRRYRREGVATATIRTRPGEGAKKALDLAERIRGMIEGRQIKGVQPIGGVLINEQGQDITGYNVIVTYPFYFDERG